MHVLLKRLKSFFYSLMTAFVLVASMVLFLLTTTPGLYLAVKLANGFLPGQLSISKANGQLADHLTIEQLSYKDQKMTVTMVKVQLDWSFASLLRHQLILKKLQADSLTISYHLFKQDSKKQAWVIPHLPLMIEVQDAQIKDMYLQLGPVSQHLRHVHVKMQLSNEHWQIHSLGFEYQGHKFHFEMKGIPIFPFPLNSIINIQAVDKKIPAIQGQLRVGGDLLLYHWQGQFTRPARLTVNGLLKNGSDLKSDIQWHQLFWPASGKPALTSDEGRVRIAGTLPNLTLNMDAVLQTPLASKLQMQVKTTRQTLAAKGILGSQHSEIDFSAHYNDQATPKIQGDIKAKALHQDDNPLLMKQIKGEAHFRGNTFDTLSAQAFFTALYDKRLLKGSLDYQYQKIEVLLSLGANRLHIQGTTPASWKILATIPEPALLHPDLQGLSSSLSIKAQSQSAQDGKLTFKIGKGHFQLPDLEPLPFEGGELTARLDKNQLQATGQFVIDPHKKMAVHFSLPHWQFAKITDTKQPLKGELSLNINSLDFIKNLSPVLANPMGQLSARLSASGSIGKPIIKGNLSVTKAQVTIPALGLNLNPVELKLTSHDKRWTLQGALFNQNHRLSLTGKGEFSPSMNGIIQLEGHDFPLINSEEYQLEISPKLALDFSPLWLKMSGKLLIPKARLKPRHFSTSVNLSEDVTYVGDKPTDPNPLHLDIDARLEMGKDVQIAVIGLQGYLDGAIQLRQRPDDFLRGNGELTVRDGKYNAYSQDLTIAQGQLLFTGGLVENPGIKIRAVRQFNNASASFAGSNRLFDFNTANLQNYDFGNKTTVGVEVTGRLNAPKLQLFAIPSTMSQANILSMLILGKPANQASKSGGQLLLTAISSMNLDSGTGGVQLLDQLKKSLGFDFNLENNPQYNQQTHETTDSTSFVVGKALSNRLYLSYSLGFTQTGSNLLTLKYLLNKYFSIQVSASLVASGADLLYTPRKDESND